MKNHLEFTSLHSGYTLFGFLWILVLAGCGSTDVEKPQPAKGPASIPSVVGAREEATAASRIRWISHAEDYGLNFSYWTGRQAGLFTWIESNGGGLGFLDFDRDGWEDLILPGGGNFNAEREMIAMPHEVMQRVGPGKYRPVAEFARIAASRSYSFGPHVADYDQDGFLDVLIPGYGAQQLFRNQGDGTFEDVTMQVGLVGKTWNSNAAWGDIDSDGQLDLFISHYCKWSMDADKPCYSEDGNRDACLPMDYPGEDDQLLRQTGDGRFEDLSATLQAPARRGLSVLSGDFDGDGDIDFYVANDIDPNYLWENNGKGKFQEIGVRSGTAMGSRVMIDGSMGIAFGDFDGNLYPDFLVTNYQDQFLELFANQGKNFFKLATRTSGMIALGSRNVCWGTAFLDAEQDGDEDLIVVCGHVILFPKGSTNRQTAFCLENVDRRRFRNVQSQAGPFFDELLAARGLAVADIDRDGDMDCAVTLIEEPARILENASIDVGNYLQIDLVGTQSNRDAIGAIVELTADGHKQVRHRYNGGSYSSSHQMTIHFGLSDASSVDQLTVRWPSGQRSNLENVSVNQRIMIVEPTP